METASETESQSFGRRFMKALIDASPRLTPELVSASEQFKEQFNDIDSFIHDWWAIPATSYADGMLVGESFWGPHWKRRSALASRGMVNHGLIDVKGRRTLSNLWFEARWKPTVNFELLFEDWVGIAKPSIGMIHLFTDRERLFSQAGASASFAAGSFGGPAKPGIPNMGWAMAYGDEYLKEVDVSRIKNRGFFVYEREDVVVVRVTEKLSDVADNFDYFSKRRSELKSMFNPELFWIKDEPD
jgi:hypothetical protein